MQAVSTSHTFIPRTGFEPGAYYTTREAAEITGHSTKAFEAWRLRGEGPRFVKLGRSVRYRGEDLLAWIAANLRSAT